MNNRIETNLLYLVKDLRSDYASIINQLTISNDNRLDIVNTYVELILKQIKNLDKDLKNPDKFIKDIKFINTYSKAIKNYIKSLNDDNLFGIYISILDGLVYCDDIASLYIDYISGDSLTRQDIYNKEVNSSKVKI